MNDKHYKSYSEWRHALTELGKITLTPEYARERVEALQNPQDPSTAEFVKLYGEPYLHQVIQWFQKVERGY